MQCGIADQGLNISDTNKTREMIKLVPRDMKGSLFPVLREKLVNRNRAEYTLKKVLFRIEHKHYRVNDIGLM